MNMENRFLPASLVVGFFVVLVILHVTGQLPPETEETLIDWEIPQPLEM